jgi:hypothetical protein
MPEKKEAATDEAGIEERIRALDRMTTGELADEYERLHRRECRTRHRAYLIRKIAWRLQANAEGDLSERARRRAAELADDAEVRVMAPRAVVAPPRTTVRLTPRLASRGRHEDPRVPPPASTMGAYPVQRHRFPVRWLRAQRASTEPGPCCSSMPLIAMTKPGVQKPHWLP